MPHFELVITEHLLLDDARERTAKERQLAQTIIDRIEAMLWESLIVGAPNGTTYDVQATRDGILVRCQS